MVHSDVRYVTVVLYDNNLPDYRVRQQYVKSECHINVTEGEASYPFVAVDLSIFPLRVTFTTQSARDESFSLEHTECRMPDMQATQTAI